MTDRLKTLREERFKLAGEMRAITDLAEKEKRDLSSEEAAKHKELFGKTETKREQIEAEERQIEVDRSLAKIENVPEKDKKDPDSAEARQARAFQNWLRSGESRLSEQDRKELRALSAGSDPDGGYLVAPQQFVKQLLQAVDNAVFIRQKATKFQLEQSASLGVPSLDSDVADADWTSGLGTGSEDTAMKFGKRELRPNPIAKRLKISKVLMRSSALPIEQIVRQRLAYKFGITEEKAYLTGDGAKKPLGVFTASNDGIGTDRDVSNGNTTTAITFDGLLAAKYSLKGQYWKNAEWLFHRNAVEMITKLKDSYGQYLWRPSVREGEPDRLLGHALNVSEYVPNTFTTGLYVGMFADFSFYWIADALDMQMQVLNELYAETNQIGIIGRKETDGMPVLSEAFARVKLG